MSDLSSAAVAVKKNPTMKDLIEAQGKAIFWMEKPHVTRQLERWPPDRLATAANRLLAAERAVKSAASAGPILVAAELIQIARVAARPR